MTISQTTLDAASASSAGKYDCFYPLDAARSGGASSVGAIDVNSLGGSSLQLMFAKLQLSLAESSKNSSMEYIKDIQKTQGEQKTVAAMLQQARQLQADAKTSGGCTTMPTDMRAYMDTNGLARDTTDSTLASGSSAADADDLHNKDEWEVAITSLQARMDSLGTDTQQKMVYVQDFMGQYNSYLQGANSVIQQSNQTLAELARAR